MPPPILQMKPGATCFRVVRLCVRAYVCPCRAQAFSDRFATAVPRYRRLTPSVKLVVMRGSKAKGMRAGGVGGANCEFGR